MDTTSPLPLKFRIQEWLVRNMKGDRYIWVIAITLLFWSIPVVYSASVKDAYTFKQGDTEYFLYKHILHCILALVVMYLVHLVPYTKFVRFTRLGVFLAIPLLLFAIFGGKSVNEASRWIEIPFLGHRFQPSEFAKVALITHLSLVLARHIKGGWTPRELFMEPIMLIGVICGLIFISNVSTALLIGAIAFMLMFVGKVPLKYLTLMLATLAFFGFLAVIFKAGTRTGTAQSRITAFMNKDTVGYQSKQSYMAMARGGLLGEGVAKSRQRRFLPEPQKDFIYAVTVEEFGTIGGFGLLMLYMALLYRGLQAIKKTKKPFGGLLSAGHTFGIVFQALCTMAVTVGLFPVTGQNLPFFSLGGTSMLLTAVSLGMILSVSRGELEEKNI